MPSPSTRTRPSRRARRSHRVRVPNYVIAAGVVLLTLGLVLGVVLAVVFVF